MARKQNREAMPEPEPEPETEPVVARPPPRLCVPGIYDGVPEADYHADPCPEPSLSRSVMKLLIDLSPQHAYVAHPRVSGMPDLPDDGGDEVMDFGTAAHSSFLLSKSIITRLDFPDWRTPN